MVGGCVFLFFTIYTFSMCTGTRGHAKSYASCADSSQDIAFCLGSDSTVRLHLYDRSAMHV